MRIAWIAGLLLCAGAAGQSVVRSNTDTHRPETEIAATMSLISTNYCSLSVPNRPLGMARFFLRARIANRGQRSVILCPKYIGSDPIVLKSQRLDGTAGEIVGPIINIPRDVDRAYPTDLSRNYVVLKPQASFEFVTHTGIMFSLAKDQRPAHGTYLMEIPIHTWGAPPEAARELGERWKSIGYLLSERLTPNLVRVDVAPPEGALSNCPAGG